VGQEEGEREGEGVVLLLTVTLLLLRVAVCDCEAEGLEEAHRVGEPVLLGDTVELREGVCVGVVAPLLVKDRVAVGQGVLERDTLMVAVAQAEGVEEALRLGEALAHMLGVRTPVPEVHWLALLASEGVEVALGQGEARGEGVAQEVTLTLGLLRALRVREGVGLWLGEALPGALPLCVCEMLAVRLAGVGETLGQEVPEADREGEAESVGEPEEVLLTEGELVVVMVREGEAEVLGHREELTLVLGLREARLELLAGGEKVRLPEAELVALGEREELRVTLGERLREGEGELVVEPDDEREPETVGEVVELALPCGVRELVGVAVDVAVAVALEVSVFTLVALVVLVADTVLLVDMEAVLELLGVAVVVGVEVWLAVGLREPLAHMLCEGLME
jgi:hypothetical protein